MSTMTLDTHALAVRYKKVGFTEEQVEAMVEAARETSALPDVSKLATTSYIDTAVAKVKADLVMAMLTINGAFAAILFFALTFAFKH